MAYYRRVTTHGRVIQYQNYQPVAKFMSPDHIQGFCTAEEAYKLVQHLRNYNGTYNLMAEMRDKFNGQNGFKQSGLSEKQWSIVKKNMEREAPVPAFKPIILNDKLIDIVINKGSAFNHFKKKLGMDYAIFTLRVHSIENAERSRSGQFYKLKLRVSANADGNVSACRVCGKALTDPTSITTGIGPTCAKHIGAVKAYKTDVTKFMEELKKEFAKVGITEMEIWNSNIVEGGDEIMQLVENHFKTPVDEIEHVTIRTDHINWVPQTKSFNVDASMHHHSDIKQLYDVLHQGKKVYVNVLNPATTNWHRFEPLTRQIDNAWVFTPCDLPLNNKVQSLIVKQ